MAQHNPVAFMSTLNKNFQLTAALLCSGFLLSCDNLDVPDDQSNERLSITNNDLTLEARVLYFDNALGIDNGTSPKSAPGMRAKPVVPVLKLVAEIQSPVINGETVQATSVSFSKFDAAMVSYNMRGATRLGAIDWINYFATKKPTLSSAVSFNDSDINAVSTDGFNVFAAVATDAPEFGNPAVLETLRLKFGKLVLDDNARIQLSSYAATSTLHAGKSIYATSGDNGHVVAYKDSTMEKSGEFALHDARWVALDEAGGRIVVVQGTPGQLSIFEEGVFPGGSLTLLNTFSFPGANVAESKSTVEIAGGKAIIAAGPEGVQIMCLDSGQIIGSVPRPDPASLGLDPAVVVTNAVTVDENLMFISNGEAGVYVAEADEDFTNGNCNAQNITMLGKLQFDNLQSANHVVYRDGFLYVAAGLGGVKIVSVNVD